MERRAGVANKLGRAQVRQSGFRWWQGRQKMLKQNGLRAGAYVKGKTNIVQRQNAEIFSELLSIEQKKAKRLEDLIHAFKMESEREEQKREAEIRALKAKQTEIAEHINRRAASDVPLDAADKRNGKLSDKERDMLEIRCKGLQSANDELMEKIKSATETDEVAREKLKIYDELEYWRKKYYSLEQLHSNASTPSQINEETKMRKELERLKKGGKKYKTAYLKLKKPQEELKTLERMPTIRTEAGDEKQGRNPMNYTTSIKSEGTEHEFAVVKHKIELLKKQISKRAVFDQPIHIIQMTS